LADIERCVGCGALRLGDPWPGWEQVRDEHGGIVLVLDLCPTCLPTWYPGKTYIREKYVDMLIQEPCPDCGSTQRHRPYGDYDDYRCARCGRPRDNPMPGIVGIS
jgi:hypothetical protein